MTKPQRHRAPTIPRARRGADVASAGDAFRDSRCPRHAGTPSRSGVDAPRPKSRGRPQSITSPGLQSSLRTLPFPPSGRSYASQRTRTAAFATVFSFRLSDSREEKFTGVAFSPQGPNLWRADREQSQRSNPLESGRPSWPARSGHPRNLAQQCGSECPSAAGTPMRKAKARVAIHGSARWMAGTSPG